MVLFIAARQGTVRYKDIANRRDCASPVHPTARHARDYAKALKAALVEVINHP